MALTLLAGHPARTISSSAITNSLHLQNLE